MPFSHNEEKSEARATTLHLGVTGEARVFIKSLPEGECYNFEILSSELKERFPQRQPMGKRGLILSRMMALKQESKNLEQYADAGREIGNEAPTEDQEVLADRWIAGLANKNLRMNVKSSNYTAKQNGSAKPMHLEQCISAAIYLKGEEEYEEPETSAQSQEEQNDENDGDDTRFAEGNQGIEIPKRGARGSSDSTESATQKPAGGANTSSSLA